MSNQQTAMRKSSFTLRRFETEMVKLD